MAFKEEWDLLQHLVLKEVLIGGVEQKGRVYQRVIVILGMVMIFFGCVGINYSVPNIGKNHYVIREVNLIKIWL